MSALRLDIQADAYELRLDGEVLGRLEGGATALLSGAGERLREIDIETAIERAEEWLMPSSKRFQGLELQVHDATGRLPPVAGDQASCTPVQVEDVFDRTHDAVVRGQVTDRAAVADGGAAARTGAPRAPVAPRLASAAGRLSEPASTLRRR